MRAVNKHESNGAGAVWITTDVVASVRLEEWEDTDFIGSFTRASQSQDFNAFVVCRSLST